MNSNSSARFEPANAAVRAERPVDRAARFAQLSADEAKFVSIGCAATIVVLRFEVALAVLSSTAAILFVSERIPGNADCTCETIACNWSETGGISTARNYAVSSPGWKIL